jgi:DNA (cytosine-5)-methyltransferase 1
VAAKTSGTIVGGVHATKGKTKKGKGTPVPKREETLTQCWRRRPDSPVEKTIKKARTSNNQCVKDQTGKLVKVEIEKTIYGPHKESITFQRGDVWVWTDKGIRFAFKLGYIHAYDGVFHAVIDEIWMDLVYTYIGQFGTSVKESLGCDWVLLEKGKHPHMPPGERIKLNTLSHKLDHAQEPLIIYTEDKTSVSYRLSTPNQTVPQHNSDRPIALDIFAGAGGASIGFELAGWNVQYKAEMNATCVDTLRENFKGKHIYQVDVANLLSELMSGSIDTTEIVWIHGSPPCQGFSFANTSGGINDRQNKDCTLDFLEIVAKIQPPFVSIENVPGFDSKRKLNDLDPENKVYLQTVIAKLLSLGYNVSKTITMASNFGDPQDRKRLVLFASKQGYMLPTLLQTHGGVLLPNVTVGDVLRDLEEIQPTCDGPITINGKTVEGHYIKDTEFTNGKTPNDCDFRLKAKNTACTLTKKNKIVHYNHKRYLTLLEYKRLMSFPDDHVIFGNAKEIRDQIGNAVPCRFAEAIGKAVMNSYRKGRKITGNDSIE